MAASNVPTTAIQPCLECEESLPPTLKKPCRLSQHHLKDAFEGTKRELLTSTCPKCGHDFDQHFDANWQPPAAAQAAPPAVASYKHHDEAYNEFAKACAQDPDDQGVMHFPKSGVIEMTNELDAATTKVFARPCYTPLFNESMLAENVTLRSKIKAFILGTPGCGKSYARMFYCHRLLQMAKEQGKAAYILFQKGNKGGPSPVHVVRRSAGVEGKLDALFFPSWQGGALENLVIQWQLETDFVVSLVDVSEGEWNNALINDVISRRVFFSSPHEAIVQGFADKFKEPHTYLFVMPLWTNHELARANTVLKLGLSDETLAKRTLAFGRTARAVLGTEKLLEGVEGKLHLALTSQELRAKLFNLIKADAHLDQLTSTMSHSLIHLTKKEDSLGYSWAHRDHCWASEEIKQQVVRKLLEIIDETLLGVMGSNRASGAKGELVEAFWFQRVILAAQSVPEQRQVRVEALGEKPVTCVVEALLHYTTLEERWFSASNVCNVASAALSDLAKAASGYACLLKPCETNYPAIDGILVTRCEEQVVVLLLQATIAETHSTENSAAISLGRLVQHINEQHPSGDVWLAFVLSFNRFGDFDHQQICIKAGFAASAEARAQVTAASNLHQCKISLGSGPVLRRSKRKKAAPSSYPDSASTKKSAPKKKGKSK